jgi:hypothetical protein
MHVDLPPGPNDGTTRQPSPSPELVARLRRAQDTSKRLIREAKAAGAGASAVYDRAAGSGRRGTAVALRLVLGQASRFVVAVEVLPMREVIAHLLLDIGPLTPRLSMTVCGQPAEYLAVLPDRRWKEIETERRCGHCGSDAAST